MVLAYILFKYFIKFLLNPYYKLLLEVRNNNGEIGTFCNSPKTIASAFNNVFAKLGWVILVCVLLEFLIKFPIVNHDSYIVSYLHATKHCLFKKLSLHGTKPKLSSWHSKVASSVAFIIIVMTVPIAVAVALTVNPRKVGSTVSVMFLV